MANWDLFQEMNKLHKELDKAFRSSALSPLNSSFLPGIGAGDYPRFNVREDKDNYYVEALVPGIDPKDLDLNVMQGTLSLAGERKEHDMQQVTWHRRERGAGKFMRSIELPESIDISRIDAEYRDGVLLITLPKKELAKPKKIAISAQ